MKRKTKIRNQILFNLIRVSDLKSIKIFIFVLNKFLSRYYNVMDGNNGNVDGFNEEYDMEILEIKLSNFKQCLNKNARPKDVKEIIYSLGKNILINEDEKELNAIFIFKRIDYIKERNTFRIEFNKDAIHDLAFISNSFTELDENFVRDCKGKYELGIYILYRMYIKTGYINYKTERLKYYLNVNTKNNNDFVKYIKRGVDRLKQKQIEIKLETERIGSNKISNIIFKFQKEMN